MARREYDWLDDPFDDSKNAEALEEARRSRNMGCIVSAVIIVFVCFVIVGLVMFGAAAMTL